MKDDFKQYSVWKFDLSILFIAILIILSTLLWCLSICYLIWESVFDIFFLWNSVSIKSVVFLIFLKFGVAATHANIHFESRVWNSYFCFKRISFPVMSKASLIFWNTILNIGLTELYYSIGIWDELCYTFSSTICNDYMAFWLASIVSAEWFNNLKRLPLEECALRFAWVASCWDDSSFCENDRTRRCLVCTIAQMFLCFVRAMSI